MSEPNNILHYLKRSTEFLEKKGIPNPRVDAEWILSDLLNLPRIKLYSNFENPLSESDVKVYRDRIVERGKRKPVAYITGKKGFHKFDFFVNEDVLIPRPETEELVDYIYKNFKSLFQGSSFSDSNQLDPAPSHNQDEDRISVWDLCSGSGCIGLSIAKLFQESMVTLSDISEEAVAVSKVNADKLGVLEKCRFLSSNFDDALSSDTWFDLILSNPPYIPIQEKSSLMLDVVDFEPHIALFVEDFQAFHKKLLSVIWNRLLAGGWTMIETHPNFIGELESIATQIGFQEIKRILDSSNKERFLLANKLKN
jgi:release factor glutamine methyltransferase